MIWAVLLVKIHIPNEIESFPIGHWARARLIWDDFKMHIGHKHTDEVERMSHMKYAFVIVAHTKVIFYTTFGHYFLIAIHNFIYTESLERIYIFDEKKSRWRETVVVSRVSVFFDTSVNFLQSVDILFN